MKGGVRLFLLANLAGFAALGMGQTISVKDYRSLVSYSAIDVSPDGKKVAFIEAKTDFVKDKNITRLVVADIKTGALKTLSDGKSGAAACKWSPDGKLIAYVSKDQVWVIPSGGGKACQVTHAKHGVQQYSW